MKRFVYETLRVFAAGVWLGCGALMFALLIAVSYAEDWVQRGTV